MNTKEYIEFIPVFLKKLKEDGMSESVIETNIWIVNHFKKYCLLNNIENVNMGVIKDFYFNQYDIDIYNTQGQMQTVLRRPLLILMELYESGSFYKSHQKSVKTNVPEEYFELFVKIQNEFINSLECNIKGKERKLWVIANFLTYLCDRKVNTITLLTIEDISSYILELEPKYANSTMRIIKTNLREVLNWLSNENLITFTGRQAFPLIRKDNRNVLLSSYTSDEIKRLLDTVDVSTKNGKATFFILSLISYLGLRVGDVINLKFENIDWEKKQIRITQSKTKNDLILPLIDEVKFPLLDYIKNGRHPSKDEEYVLSTLYAPYTKFNSTSSIHKLVSRSMELAGINFDGKHHGPHALRHSLATNMINNNVPVNAISQVLGHSNVRTTEIYITKDTTHLKELSLEVPYAF